MYNANKCNSGRDTSNHTKSIKQEEHTQPQPARPTNKVRLPNAFFFFFYKSNTFQRFTLERVLRRRTPSQLPQSHTDRRIRPYEQVPVFLFFERPLVTGSATINGLLHISVTVGRSSSGPGSFFSLNRQKIKHLEKRHTCGAEFLSYRPAKVLENLDSGPEDVWHQITDEH